MAYDVVIRNGMVVDGSGFGAYRADVGDRRRRRIARVGRIRERGDREIDADGHVVTPGFIDGHTHMDAQVFWDPQGANSCWHGVTTVVMGNCGFTLAPVRDDARALVVRNLERAEDIDPAALAAGIEWSWETFPEYLDAVDRLPKGINYAANIGHSALRTWAMGERAFEEEATDDDLALMTGPARRRAARRRDRLHDVAQRAPRDVRRPPGRVAPRGVGRGRAGSSASMGDLGTRHLRRRRRARAVARSRAARAGAASACATLAVDTGVPMTMGIIATNPGGYEMLDLIDSIAAVGGRMIGQTHCRGINVLLSFPTRLPFDLLPEWHDVRGAARRTSSCARCAIPAVRERLDRRRRWRATTRAGGASARGPASPTSTASGSTSTGCRRTRPSPRSPRARGVTRSRR